MLKLRKPIAALSAAVLTLGAVALGATSATAAPLPGTFVPLSGIAVPTDAVEEATAYNVWHFDPDHRAGIGSQLPNGFTVNAGGDVLVMLGNGNDSAKTTGPSTAPNDHSTIQFIANSLDVVTSDNASVTFQIPVFYGWTGTAWKFTTLRQPANATDDQWTISSPIRDAGGTEIMAGNSTAALGDIVTLMSYDNAPRAIGAGFLVYQPTAEVLVSSFTANGQTTRFYDAPAIDRKAGSVNEFVHSDNIATDATVYEGWHEEVPASDAAIGTFATQSYTSGTGYEGLAVKGKSQLIYGYEVADRPTNALPEMLADGFVIDGAPTGAQFQTQIPLFFYVEGVVGQQFTTLRSEIPANGLTDQWTTSRAIGSIPARTTDSLANLLGAISSYEVLAHGFTVESGTTLVKSVSLNGYVHRFATPEETDEAAILAETGSETGMLAVAGLGLLAIGAVTLMVRRRHAAA